MSPEFLSRQISRRRFAIGGAVGLAALSFLPSRASEVAAQEEGTALSAMGYPELAVTVTDAGFEGVPASTAAGRYLLKATSTIANDNGNTGAVAFLSPTPAGMSTADFLHLFAAGPEGGAGATPAAGGDEGGEDQEELVLPLAVYQMYFAGGVYVVAGGTAEAVIDLKPGEYIVWGDDPSVSQQPALLTVTGDVPPDVADPEADITATLIDFAIQIEGNLTAGTHILKVQHHGAQPHFLEIEKGPDSMTKEQVMTALTTEGSATPAPGIPSEQDLQPVFYSPTQSIGTVTYHHIELTEGTFLAACFFPTAGTGLPHALDGMIEVFKVSGS